MMPELKSCPFCGSAPNTSKPYMDDVYCSNENCFMTPDVACTTSQWQSRATRPDGGDSLRVAFEQADALVDLWVTCELKQGRKESAAEIIRQRTKYRAALAAKVPK